MTTDWRQRVDIALAGDHIRWRIHAMDRMRERSLGTRDLLDLLRIGALVEQDDARRPFPTAILLGQIGTRSLHVVVAWQDDGPVLHVITVYDPDVLHVEAGGGKRRR